MAVGIAAIVQNEVGQNVAEQTANPISGAVTDSGRWAVMGSRRNAGNSGRTAR